MRAILRSLADPYLHIILIALLVFRAAMWAGNAREPIPIFNHGPDGQVQTELDDLSQTHPDLESVLPSSLSLQH